MAEIIWGLATSHVPPIGLAMDRGQAQDPYWKPLFDGYAPARKWMAEHKPDAAVIVYNDHANYVGAGHGPGVRARGRRPVRDRGRGVRAAARPACCRGTGSWAWQRVAPLLRAAGHDVHTPTLTGVSDRAHLLSPSVGLSTHVTDVVSLIEVFGLSDVVLVGHSYGGQVITGVADRIADRILKRVYLDAFAGDDGEAAIDLQPETVAGHYRESVTEQGFGWLIPVRSLAKMGVADEADVVWLTPRLTPHPWLTFTEPLSLTGAVSDVPAEFIECTDWMRVFRGQRERAEARGWPVHELATGHEAMVTAPKALADLLLAIAR